MLLFLKAEFLMTVLIDFGKIFKKYGLFGQFTWNFADILKVLSRKFVDQLKIQVNYVKAVENV